MHYASHGNRFIRLHQNAGCTGFHCAGANAMPQVLAIFIANKKAAVDDNPLLQPAVGTLCRLRGLRRNLAFCNLTFRGRRQETHMTVLSPLVDEWGGTTHPPPGTDLLAGRCVS